MRIRFGSVSVPSSKPTISHCDDDVTLKLKKEAFGGIHRQQQQQEARSLITFISIPNFARAYLFQRNRPAFSGQGG
ncbi:hypothetical protein RJT34_30009 [Clitoria ternatea]|uniref:Uncharacterized protein n=1 Tax=Clitoria ternatea TaxID=43366 RepID=A0AAN9I6X9_CLITE